MIIDFHTHVYPDKLAHRIVDALAGRADVAANTDGTAQGLIDSMRHAGIDTSVVLPVATRKGQFDSINRFAKSLNEMGQGLLSFGGIHPDDDDIKGKLRYLRENGFLGVKLHPDYQDTMIDDEKYIDIVSECQRLGMIVVTHAGKDPAYDIVHCPPERGRRMLDEVYRRTGFDEPFFVFAHLGGNQPLSEVERYIVGQNCYIDISCAFADIGHFSATPDEDIVRVIHTHGADKILFATDSPWNPQDRYVERVKGLNSLTDREKEMILFENAKNLLDRAAGE